MINKSGQSGFIAFVFIVLLILLIGNWFDSTNPYKSFIEDCQDTNWESFTLYNQSCDSFGYMELFSSSVEMEHYGDGICHKIDEETLLRFCNNKYSLIEKESSK